MGSGNKTLREKRAGQGLAHTERRQCLFLLFPSPSPFSRSVLLEKVKLPVTRLKRIKRDAKGGKGKDPRKLQSEDWEVKDAVRILTLETHGAHVNHAITNRERTCCRSGMLPTPVLGGGLDWGEGRGSNPKLV